MFQDILNIASGRTVACIYAYSDVRLQSRLQQAVVSIASSAAKAARPVGLRLSQAARPQSCP